MKKLKKVRHVHLSGKVGKVHATRDQWLSALDVLSKVDHEPTDVITLTETPTAEAGRAVTDWAFERGWDIFRPKGYGKDECTILSRTPITRGRAKRLTRFVLKGARQAPIYDISARTCGIRFHVWHSPAHNGGLKPGWPTMVYMSAMSVLRKVGKGLHAYCADWNADLRRGEVQDTLHIPGMIWAVGHDQKSTIDNRVIDGVQANAKIVKRTVTLKKLPGFDHHPVLTVLGVAA